MLNCAKQKMSSTRNSTSEYFNSEVATKQPEVPLYFLREAKPTEKRVTDEFLDSLLKVRSVTDTKQVYSQWAKNYEKVCFKYFLSLILLTCKVHSTFYCVSLIHACDYTLFVCMLDLFWLFYFKIIFFNN